MKGADVQPLPPSAAAATEAAPPLGPQADPTRQDVLVLAKEAMLKRGVVKRTQDYIFYQPEKLALHKVLDVPEDAEIDSEALLPSSKHCSHHIPLVVDVSWVDRNPPVE
jgi:hypothetical protein